MMKLIINFTPTGMIPTRKMTPYVPVTVQEIVEKVHEAMEMGITMVHLHARDEQGEPTHRAEVYREIIAGIRVFSAELVICVSLSGRNCQEFTKRAEPLQLEGNVKPDMGSLTLSSLNFNQAASLNPPEIIQRLAHEMKRRGILPELEAFDAGMINYARYLESKGLLEPPHYCNLLSGNIANAQANLLHTGIMINDLPPDTYWSLAGLGKAQLTMNTMAIAAGGGVRVGIEDNIWYDNRQTKSARNIDLLRRIHELARIHQREVMSPGELRTLLNLAGGHGQYGRIYSKI